MATDKRTVINHDRCEADGCSEHAVRSRRTTLTRRLVRLCTFHDLNLTASTFGGVK